MLNSKELTNEQFTLLSEGLSASPVFGGLAPGRISEICRVLADSGSLRIASFRDGDNISVISSGDSDGLRSPENADSKNTDLISAENKTGINKSGTYKGETDKNGAFGIVLGGRVIVSRSEHIEHNGDIERDKKKETDDNTGRVVLNVLTKGGCFGVCSLFSCGFRIPPTVITSSGSSTAAFIGEEGFTELLTSDKELCTSYLRFLTGRICFLNEKLHAFSGSTVNERVAQALLSSAVPDEGGALCCRSSMAELARRLNIGRASLYRALNTMSEKGMLAHSGKVIEILDPEMLACCK